MTPNGQLHLTENAITISCDDSTIPPASGIAKYIAQFTAGVKKSGVPDELPHIAGYMREAGFTDIKIVKKKVPTNTWPKGAQMKELGR